MLRRLAPVLLGALLMTGCGVGSPPRVVFAAGADSITADPAQYCDLELTVCDDDATAPVELPVPAGTALRIEVPDDIAETPWHVVFRYRDAAGEQIDSRSAVFPPGQRAEYVLELPAPTDRLLVAQVQQFGPPPRPDPTTGELDFPIRASWVLTAAT
ncbi:MAG: DUF2771 family protein [Pseudonocardia sp.]